MVSAADSMATIMATPNRTIKVIMAAKATMVAKAITITESMAKKAMTAVTGIMAIKAMTKNTLAITTSTQTTIIKVATANIRVTTSTNTTRKARPIITDKNTIMDTSTIMVTGS